MLSDKRVYTYFCQPDECRYYYSRYLKRDNGPLILAGATALYCILYGAFIGLVIYVLS